MNKKRLSSAINHMKNAVKEIADTDLPEIEVKRADLIDAADLLGVLAHIVDGKPLSKAFGAPGDWGYSTPVGAALAADETMTQ